MTARRLVRRLMRPMPALLSTLGLLGALTACAQTMALNATSAQPVFCTMFKPILWANGDTDLTIRQVKEHNAVWSKACGIKGISSGR